MRTAALALVLTACGGSARMSSGARASESAAAGGRNAGQSEALEAPSGPPRYSRAELEHALSTEHGALEDADMQLARVAGDPILDGKYDGMAADRDVRARYVASLEACRDEGRDCPPRLDDRPFVYDPASDKDPKLDAPLRFDLADWRAITDELHARACACRTVACLDALDAAANALESRPMPQVVADDEALASLTDARACLMRLRGRRQAR